MMILFGPREGVDISIDRILVENMPAHFKLSLKRRGGDTITQTMARDRDRLEWHILDMVGNCKWREEPIKHVLKCGNCEDKIELEEKDGGYVLPERCGWWKGKHFSFCYSCVMEVDRFIGGESQWE